MRALIYDEYAGKIDLRMVESPVAGPGSVVVTVEASGICRSDWHGWMGHDADITLPQIPGHEFAGVISEIGTGVTGWDLGDRVTTPFVNACGHCGICARGDQQVCPHQTQPGFTHPGSLAEFVEVRAAETNLVRLPDGLSAVEAASLGCRFATGFRAVTAVGRVSPGDWVAVHGCGGLGLSIVHIAAAAGARVVAVDISPGALSLARRLGAEHLVDARSTDPVTAIGELTGGATVSFDALGSAATCVNSIRCLGARGRHVQVGLLPAAAGRPDIPMGRVISHELELLGSHGMAAHDYPAMLGLIAAGRLRPRDLVTREISLEQAPEALQTLGSEPGITMVTSFGSTRGLTDQPIAI